MSNKNVSLGIFGLGSVGRELCRQARAIGMSVNLVADSSSTMVSNTAEGFTDKQLSGFVELKASGGALRNVQGAGTAFYSPKQALDQLKTHCNPIVADCSAHDNAEDYLIPAVNMGIPVALANKKPLTGSLDWYKALTAQPQLARFEATCGAGLPVLCSLDRLLASGDVVTKIEGQLSGTLGYILSGLEDGRKFSEVVVDAVEAKYAEPDPRDDLSGTDVARKALILARRLGDETYQTIQDVEVEALYPESMSKLSVAEFIKQLPSCDAYFAEKTRECQESNTKLRYCATIEPGKKLQVGLKAVPVDSPLGGLKGTDNLVSFSTKYYNTSPLVVVGPGAGVSVTAGGVLADLVELRRTVAA